MLSSKDDQIQDILSQLEQLEVKEKEKLEQFATTPVRTELLCNSFSLPDAPSHMCAGSSTVDGSKAYFRCNGRRIIYEYDSQKQQWSVMPVNPNKGFTIVCIDHILVSVGGCYVSWFGEKITNTLYSLVDTKWVELFPPLPTKRKVPTVVYVNDTLVVAGGFDGESSLSVVEVLYTQTKQWCVASSLPFTMSQGSAVVWGDNVYFTAGDAPPTQEKYTVLKCSLTALVQSKPNSTVWEKMTPLPTHLSSLAIICGQLLAIGGSSSKFESTKDVNRYNPVTNSWEIVGQMLVARNNCLTAALPNKMLMVVGSYGLNNRVEIVKFM